MISTLLRDVPITKRDAANLLDVSMADYHEIVKNRSLKLSIQPFPEKEEVLCFHSGFDILEKRLLDWTFKFSDRPYRFVEEYLNVFIDEYSYRLDEAFNDDSRVSALKDISMCTSVQRKVLMCAFNGSSIFLEDVIEPVRGAALATWICEVTIDILAVAIETSRCFNSIATEFRGISEIPT